MNTAPRILVIYAHPYPTQSRVNRRLSAVARDLPHVHVHDLYEAYPDFHIDTEHEQRLLIESDLIVFQHPWIWYGMPSLLKEWVDTVLEAGWAYGNNGNALRGKDFWMAITVGGEDKAYCEGAYHGHPFAAFLPPFRQMAALCGMHWHEPLVLFDADEAGDEAVSTHVEGYRQRLDAYPAWKD